MPESLENTNTLYFPFKYFPQIICSSLQNITQSFAYLHFFTSNHLLLWLFLNQALAFKKISTILGRALCEGIMWDVNSSLKEQAISSLGVHSSREWVTHKPQRPNAADFFNEFLNPLRFLGIHRGAEHDQRPDLHRA